MFGDKEFDEALRAYKKEKDSKSSNAFADIRKGNKFFGDIASKEDLNTQIETFINLISEMNREKFENRYVILSFILDFCRYLERDFLFNIKNKRDFLDLKEKVGEFIKSILEANRNFSQSAKLHTIEHLLEYYGILLDAMDESAQTEEEYGLWAGNKLW